MLKKSGLEGGHQEIPREEALSKEEQIKRLGIPNHARSRNQERDGSDRPKGEIKLPKK